MPFKFTYQSNLYLFLYERYLHNEKFKKQKKQENINVVEVSTHLEVLEAHSLSLWIPCVLRYLRQNEAFTSWFLILFFLFNQRKRQILFYLCTKEAIICFSPNLLEINLNCNRETKWTINYFIRFFYFNIFSELKFASYNIWF